jgi:Protein of unknown function (DUF3037)
MSGSGGSTRMAFEYAVLRAVPRVDRGECVNVGVVLYCQAADYLRVLVHVDEARLRSLDPSVDVDAVRSALAGVEAVCAGDAAAGPAAAGSRRERFGWLTAPRSTVVQAGPVHSGVTHDPDGQLHRLLDRLVTL